ncbi:Uncharacterised protein [Candidatus Bilamarchaeum dharawalense]|uniref:Uncharacterized protein n=1 Tax=Candidatus Bilamarchaeum dharawalense TaxID=2885759 RepID=A0A5E4LTJ2_9ARCH|nr:Uncharacterised protein [Candidatus Bilamarchaeum dharawalense]
MKILALPSDVALQLTKPEIVKRPKLLLKPLDPEGIVGGASNVWGNEKGEKFASVRDPKSTRNGWEITISRIMGGQRPYHVPWVSAYLKIVGDGIEITSIADRDNHYYAPPPPEKRGRGLFGAVLAETVLFCLENGSNTVLITPESRHVRAHYANYGFQADTENRMKFSVDHDLLKE